MAVTVFPSSKDGRELGLDAPGKGLVARVTRFKGPFKQEHPLNFSATTSYWIR